MDPFRRLHDILSGNKEVARAFVVSFEHYRRVFAAVRNSGHDHMKLTTAEFGAVCTAIGKIEEALSDIRDSLLTAAATEGSASQPQQPTGLNFRLPGEDDEPN